MPKSPLEVLVDVQRQVKVSEGAGTPWQEANGDVLLDGVAFSQLEWLYWGRKFSDFWGKKGSKMGRFSVKKVRKLFFIKFYNTLALTALHSAAWNHIDKVDA